MTYFGLFALPANRNTGDRLYRFIMPDHLFDRLVGGGEATAGPAGRAKFRLSGRARECQVVAKPVLLVDFSVGSERPDGRIWADYVDRITVLAEKIEEIL